MVIIRTGSCSYGVSSNRKAAAASHRALMKAKVSASKAASKGKGVAKKAAEEAREAAKKAVAATKEAFSASGGTESDTQGDVKK